MNPTSDIVGFSASLALLIAYQGYPRYRLSQDPGYTAQRVNNLVRAAWVEEIMRRREGVLAVQTLRNSMMAAVFLTSTAVLMIIGVLTLSEQGDKLRTTWQALDVFGAADSRLWLAKMLLLWLFGPHLMLAGTVALVISLHFLDRTPRVPASDS